MTKRIISLALCLALLLPASFPAAFASPAEPSPEISPLPESVEPSGEQLPEEAFPPPSEPLPEEQPLEPLPEEPPEELEEPQPEEEACIQCGAAPCACPPPDRRLENRSRSRDGATAIGKMSEDAVLSVLRGGLEKAERLGSELLNLSDRVKHQSYVYHIDLSGEYEGSINLSIGGIPSAGENEKIYVIHLLDSAEAIAESASARSYIGVGISALFPQETAASGSADTIYYEILSAWRDAAGNVVFPTESFSSFIIYTVDFSYGDMDFSMEGGSSLLLSQLFLELGIEESAADAASVEFSTPSLLSVQRQENGDWLLCSLGPFTTSETLVITFSDGRKITITVTDAVTDYGYTPGTVYSVPSSSADYIVVWIDRDVLPASVVFKGDKKYWEVDSADPNDSYVSVSDKTNQQNITVTVNNTAPVGYKFGLRNKALIGGNTGRGIIRVIELVTFKYSPGSAVTSPTVWPGDQSNRKIGAWSMADTTANTEGRTNTFTISSTTPSAPGYTFGSWSYTDWQGIVRSAAPGSTVRLDESSIADSDYVYFTANWTPISYKISYDEAGGSAVSDQSYTVETALKLSAAPSRPGYNFAGWTLSGDEGSWKAGSYAQSRDMGQKNYGNITLVAQWTPATVKVTLDNQGADTSGTAEFWYQYATSREIEGERVYYYSDSGCVTPLPGSSITLPEKSGFAFGGYFSGRDGTGKCYISSQGLCVNELYASSTEDITLYAMWLKDEFTLSASIDRGSAEPALQTVAGGGESLPVSFVPAEGYKISAVSVNGAELESFTLQADGSYIYPAQKDVSGDISVEVRTQPLSFTLKWVYTAEDKPGETEYLIQTLYFGDAIVPPQSPRLEYYDFEGWESFPAAMPGEELVIHGHLTRQRGDLIIQKSWSGGSGTALFRISGNGMELTVECSGSLRVKDLPLGAENYVVTELDWAQGYTTGGSRSVEIVKDSAVSVSFTNTRRSLGWLFGEALKDNSFGGGF